MKKSSIAPLLLVAIFASCTRHAPETLLTKWEEKSSSDPSFSRALASSSLNEKECFKDIFDVATLKKEVTDLESKFAGSKKISGKWKHLDLSKLPVPQANFLKTYGNKIGDLKNPDSIDYSSCEDVPCVFNKIYSKENNVAGYVHYLWYLKLGHLLSADNLVPSYKPQRAGLYNGKEFPLSAYLYDDKELFGLWRLTNMLKPPHTNLTYLEEVQRIPRGSSIEEYADNVCGLAAYTGWIVLNDKCLTVSGERLDIGYLYQAVTHELTHQLDTQQSRGTMQTHRSVKQDYLDLIGMYIEEGVGLDGKPIRKWKQRGDAKLVTRYAGSSPEENFAETIAVFRTDGETTKKKISDDHYAFVSRNYYGNKNFEESSLMKNWIERYTVDTEREALRAVVDCSESSSATQKSNYFNIKDFTYQTSPKMLNCLGKKSEDIAEILRKKAALYEPEGCNTFSRTDNGILWNGYVKENLKVVLDRYLKELEADKEYVARVQSFYKDINNRKIPKEVYISCFGEKNDSDCYKEGILLKAKDQIAKLNITADQEKDLLELYLSVHPFTDVSNDVDAGYNAFVMTHLEKIRYEADVLWKGCRDNAQSDSESPKGSVFLISEGYMISSFYNCLNEKVSDSIKFAVQSFDVDGTKVQDLKEELLLSKQVAPHLLKMLKEKFTAASAVELSEIQKLVEEEDGSIRQQVRSNFSWIKNVTDSDGIQKDCRAEAISLVTFEPLYHIKGKIFSELVDKKVCAGITETPEYEKWISESEVAFKEMVMKDLDPMLYTAGLAQANQCLANYPITDSLSKIKFRTQREGCLTSNWAKVEEKVLSELKTNPLIMKFGFNLDDFKRELVKNGRRTQLKLIKENFN